MSNWQFIHKGEHPILRLGAGDSSEVRSQPVSSHESEPFPVLLESTSRSLSEGDPAFSLEAVDMHPTWYLPIIPPLSPSLLNRLKTMVLHLLSARKASR
jgi:hypothetical protein